MGPKTLFALVASACIAILGAQSRSWLLSREVAPGKVLEYFPLQVGNRWIYETKYLTGNAQSPNINRWTWEVQATRHVQTEDGLLVFRRVRTLSVLSGKPENEFSRRAAPYLVRADGYVYELSPDFWVESDNEFQPASRAHGLADIRQTDEEVRAKARKDIIKRLRDGELTPQLFFPMKVGLMWAEPRREVEEYRKWTEDRTEPNSFYHWAVIAKGGRGHCGCLKVPATAFDILYFTVGGPSEVIFQAGVGVVGEWGRHNGTYWEHTTTLKRFIRPAGDKTQATADTVRRVRR